MDEFSRVCGDGSSPDRKQTAALKLEVAVLRLNDSILRQIVLRDPGAS
jgi:hypothetical protein